MRHQLAQKPQFPISDFQVEADRGSRCPGDSDGDNTIQHSLTDLDIWRGRKISLCPAEPGLIDPIHRGMVSCRWIVSLDERQPSYFLKIVDTEQAPFINFASSFAAQRQAATFGCTPDVVFSDADKRIIVTDYLDGWRSGRMDDLQKPAIMEKVLSLKTRLHGGDPFDVTANVFDLIERFEAQFARKGLPKPDIPEHIPAAVRKIEQAITAAGRDIKPSHADGLSSNIMIGPNGGVQLVDFDQARNDDPYFEIGILLNEAFQFENEMLPALEMFEGEVRKSSLARCRLYAIVDDYAWALWAMLMDATSERGPESYLKYACWRLLRCRMAIEYQDFEKKLREL